MMPFFEFCEKYIAPVLLTIVIATLIWGFSYMTGFNQIIILIALAVSALMTLLYSYVAQVLFFPLTALTIMFYIVCEIMKRIA